MQNQDNEFENFVLNRIKEEMRKKKLSNRKLAKLLKGDSFKEGRDDVWIGQKLSGNRKLRIDEFGEICEKLEINPALIFAGESNPYFLKTSLGEVLKHMAKSIANELNKLS